MDNERSESLVVDAIPPQTAAPDQPDAYASYTEEELMWWVRLLRKRAEHRTDLGKQKQDLLDARAYELILLAIRTVREEFPDASGA